MDDFYTLLPQDISFFSEANDYLLNETHDLADSLEPDLTRGSLTINEEKFNSEFENCVQFLERLIVNKTTRERFCQYYTQSACSLFHTLLNNILFIEKQCLVSGNQHQTNLSIKKDLTYLTTTLTQLTLQDVSTETKMILPGQVKINWQLTPEGFLFDSIHISNPTLIHLLKKNEPIYISTTLVKKMQAEEKLIAVGVKLYKDSQVKDFLKHLYENQSPLLTPDKQIKVIHLFQTYLEQQNHKDISQLAQDISTAITDYNVRLKRNLIASAAVLAGGTSLVLSKTTENPYALFTTTAIAATALSYAYREQQKDLFEQNPILRQDPKLKSFINYIYTLAGNELSLSDANIIPSSLSVNRVL